MLTLQRRLVAELLGGSRAFTVGVAALYAAILLCAAFVGLADPGQLQGEQCAQWLADEAALPKRAHKSWLYERPVLRFDHYCRWLGNCIGLRNHREFMLMTCSLSAAALLGAAVDAVLLFARARAGEEEAWVTELLLLLHLVYSLAFARYVVPIFRLHVGFVSRNELAREWKEDLHYVVHDAVTGEPVAVADLDVDEYNEHFDSFEYERSLNPYDQGWRQNCWTFWCTPRWAGGQLGEF